MFVEMHGYSGESGWVAVVGIGFDSACRFLVMHASTILCGDTSSCDVSIAAVLSAAAMDIEISGSGDGHLEADGEGMPNRVRATGSGVAKIGSVRSKSATGEVKRRRLRGASGVRGSAWRCGGGVLKSGMMGSSCSRLRGAGYCWY